MVAPEMRDSLTATLCEDNAPSLRPILNSQRFETEQHGVHLRVPNFGTSSLRIVWRGRGGEFLETRIIPQWIEHRIEPE